MSERRRVFLLVGIMTAIVIVVSAVSMLLLYKAGVVDDKIRLFEMARSQALLAESIFHRELTDAKSPSDATEITLKQIREANDEMKWSSSTGEVAMAERRGDWIHFLVRRQRKNANIQERILLDGPDAAPMRRALSGQSGVMIGLDYRGKKVLAAYEPVADLGWGIVAKTDLAELQEPFLKAVALSALAALALAFAGAALFVKITNPIFKQIHDSEQRFRMLFENMLDGFALHEIILDESGKPCDYRFIMVNPAFERMTRLLSENVVGKTVLQVIPSTENYWIEAYGKVTLTGEPAYFENYSEELNQHFKVTAFRVNEGQFAVIFSDISERVRIEKTTRRLNVELEERVEERTEELHVNQIELEMQNEQLKRTQAALKTGLEKYTDLFEFAPVGYFTLDRKGTIRQVNLIGTQLVGVDRSHLKGKRFGFLVSPETRPAFNTFLESAFTSHNKESCDVVIPNKTGSLIYVQIEAAAGSSDDERRFAVLDITERKQAEEALRSASLYSRGLIEISLDPLVTISREGIITDVNTATEKVTGLNRKQLVGSDFSDHFTEPEMARAGYEKVFEQGQVTDYPLAIRHISGAVTDVLYNASIYRNEQGEIVGVFAAARDVTERKKGEKLVAHLNQELELRVDELASTNVALGKELVEKERMETQLLSAERLATLGQLSGSIAHEIRNPLGTIASSIYYLKTRLQDTDEKVSTHLDRMNNAISRALAVIESLLDLTRSKELRVTEIDLAEVVPEAIRLSKTPSTVAITQNIDAGLIISADREQIIMVVTNIVGNAVEAMDGDGSITVIGKKAEDGWAELTFADNGPGILPENIGKIFQPLFTTKHKGVGFGLSIVKQVIERHGGTIEARSELGAGATIVVRMKGKEMGKM